MPDAGLNRELIIEQILNAVKAVQEEPNRWKGLCPAHDDHNPSLGIYINPDGYIGFKCYSRNCKHETIVKAIKDKFNIVVPGRRHTNPSSKTYESNVLYPAHENEFPFRLRKEEDTIYEYFMPNGDLAFVVQRFIDEKNKKQIIPWFSKEFISEIGRSEKSWEAKNPPKSNRPIFNLHLLEHYKDKPVLIVEGEKTALAAMQMKEFEGYVITTWSGGSQAVRMSDWQILRERQTLIYLWPDYDDAGIRAMKEVAKFITTGPEDTRLNLLTFGNLIDARISKGWDLADGFNNAECSYSFEDFHFEPYHIDEKLISATIEETLAIRDKRLRILHHGTRDYIIDLERKTNGPFNYKTYSDVRSLTIADNEKVMIEVGEKIKFVYAAEEWFTTRGQNSSVYLEGVKFDPTVEAVEISNKDGTRSLNTFLGFPKFTEESNDKLVEIFLEHLDKMIMDKKVVEWVLDYFAHIFQYPGSKPGTAILLLGRQGVGKSVLIKVLNRLLGDLSKILTRELTTNNIALSNSLLVYHDEWSINLHKERIYYDMLKNVIDSPKIRVSEKYLQPWDSDSFCRFIFTSNSMEEIKFPPDDRRFTVVDCNSYWLKNDDHFKKFFELMKDDGALAGLFKYFKERKIVSNLTLNLHTSVKEDLWLSENEVLQEIIGWANGEGLPMELGDILGEEATDRFGEEPILVPRKVMKDVMTSVLGKHKYGKLSVGLLKRILPGPEYKRTVKVYDRKGEGTIKDLCFIIPDIETLRANIETEIKRAYPWQESKDSYHNRPPQEEEKATVVPFKKKDIL